MAWTKQTESSSNFIKDPVGINDFAEDLNNLLTEVGEVLTDEASRSIEINEVIPWALQPINSSTWTKM